MSPRLSSRGRLLNAKKNSAKASPKKKSPKRTSATKKRKPAAAAKSSSSSPTKPKANKRGKAMKDDGEEKAESHARSSPRRAKKRKIQFGDVQSKEIEARSKTSGTSLAYTVLSSQATGGDAVYRRFDVERAVQMREFLKENGLRFERGSTYCRVTDKSQLLTQSRSVVLVSRESVGDDPDVYDDGAKCRQLLKLKGDAKHHITAASAPKFEIYVSSALPSKTLEAGSTFLYRVPEQLENIAPTVERSLEVDTPKQAKRKAAAPAEKKAKKQPATEDGDDEEEEKTQLNPEDMPVDSCTFLTNPDKKTFWELTLRGSAHVIRTGKLGPRPRSSSLSVAKTPKKTPQKRKRSVPSTPQAPPPTPQLNVKTTTQMCASADEAAFKAAQEIMKKQSEGFMTEIQVKRRRRERRIEKKIDEADSSAAKAAASAAAPSPTASAKKKVLFYRTQLFKGKQFWECRVLPTEIVVRSGRIGSQGKAVSHKCKNVHTAAKKARTMIAQQKRAGYMSWAESVQK